MSKLQVDNIVNKDDTGSVGFSRGTVVTGVCTATTFSGDGSGLTGVASTDNIITGTAATFSGGITVNEINVSGVATFASNVSIAGTLTYEDVTNIDSVGIITARSGVQITGGELTLVGTAFTVSQAGVVTATSYRGDGSNLTGINAAPSFTATASGTLANGDTVVINSNGTVSKISGNDDVVGTAVTIHSDSRFEVAAVYDTNADKVVVAYREDDDGDAGHAAVGTISGTSISFGTPVEFVSATSSLDATFDSTNNKVVIGYTDAGDSSKGKAIVGTVTGTGITFGSAYEFESGNTAHIACGYDQSRQKVVIVYRDDGDGDVGKGVIATVTGTSLSYGSVVEYESNVVTPVIVYDSTNSKTLVVFRDFSETTQGSVRVIQGSGNTFDTTGLARFTTGYIKNPRACFDPDTGQVIISYSDTGDSDKGKVITCDASTSTPTFGTAVEFNSGDTRNINIAYHEGVNKIALIYEDHDNNEAGRLLTGTVSGTTVSFDSVQTILASKFAEYNDIIYDPDQDRIGIFYTDDTASAQPLEAVVYQAASSNLTSENYLGISNAAYSDGATATIQIVGSVDDAQSGLTTARKHYVQNDGSLALTAGPTSVVAGTALNSTNLRVGL